MQTTVNKAVQWLNGESHRAMTAESINQSSRMTSADFLQQIHYFYSYVCISIFCI